MNTPADPGQDHPARILHPVETPAPQPSSQLPCNPKSAIPNPQSPPSPPPLHIQDRIHPTDLLPPSARLFTDIEASANANGYKLTTLRRAFRQLGGEAVRVGYGPLGEWFWRLPGIGDQNPKPTFGDLWKDLEKNASRAECRI